MKRRISWLVICAALIIVATVSTTIAYLVASSNTVTNTFTAGNITITLTESTGTSYPMVPATTVKKNPTVTVKGGSEECWLFVKVNESVGFDTYMSYEIDTDWTALDGVPGVYFRQVEETETDITYSILKDNVVAIKETVTEEQLDALETNPSLSFLGYAIQTEGNENVRLAWQNISAKEE